MVYFVCRYCEKPIQGMVTIDGETNISHPECIEKKWESAFEEGGILHGIKGPIKNEKMTKLLECCKSSKIE